MTVGDFVVLAPLGGGAEFVGRISAAIESSEFEGYEVRDGRGQVWRRASCELKPAPANDPRVIEFVERPAAAPAAAKLGKLTGRGENWRPLADRICEALAAGLETAPDIAVKLGSSSGEVASRLHELGSKGRALKTGFRDRPGGGRLILWKLAGRPL